MQKKVESVLFLIMLVILTGSATLHGQSVVQLDLGGKRMPDPEFDLVGYQVAWQDEKDNLWVAAVDPVSGDIGLSNAQMIATGLAPNAPIDSGLATGDGPNWVYTSQGSQILYTVQVGQLGPNGWRIGVAKKTATGWESGTLNDPAGIVGGAPDGSKVVPRPVPPSNSDSDPLISYYFAPAPGKRALGWVNLNKPSIRGVVPFQFRSPAKWVSGEFFFVSAARFIGVDQVVSFDPAKSNTYTQLTLDRNFSKSKPEMWHAPEFGGQLVFFALEQTSKFENPKQIGVYRVINGMWTKFKTIIPPSGPNFPTVYSPEPFVFDGHSYIVMAMIGNRSDLGTEIWIAGIGANNFYRKIAGPENNVRSGDPEYLITRDANRKETGVFIYLAQNGGKQVYRADTGLRPQPSP